MSTVPKITDEHATQAIVSYREKGFYSIADICNKANEIALAEQQETYITAAQPEPVDPHAALRAEYAKQVEEGTTGFYLWELQNCKGEWLNIGCRSWATDVAYRCTDISCYVSIDGEPAIRMLRTEAQELQDKTRDECDWFTPFGSQLDVDDDFFSFGSNGTYTYRTKGTIKLDGNMVTPEQAAAEWEAKKETHDLWYRSDRVDWCIWFLKQLNKVENHNEHYELRPKEPTWTGSRDDVIALLKEVLTTGAFR
jgi:hypothetical protein